MKEKERPFYFGHYMVTQDGRIRNSRGQWLSPVMPPGYAEAAYNLRHRKKSQRIKARTIMRLVWGKVIPPERFDLHWIKQVRTKNGKTCLSKESVAQSDRSWRLAMASVDPYAWWNGLDYTPGCQGPADPQYCPLDGGWKGVPGWIAP